MVSLIVLPRAMSPANRRAPGTVEALEADVNGREPTRSLELGRKQGQALRVHVAAENRLLREALALMLTKGGSLEVVGLQAAKPLEREAVLGSETDVMLPMSEGCVEEELERIQQVRAWAPKIRILVIGMTRDQGEFLQCVRAGVSGYLLQDSSAAEVLEAIEAVHAGEAVCPGSLCSVLFRYFEREMSGLPFASVRQRLDLTRREQQVVPLIAKGLTNKA
jgi:DNA-binding NarL/FixJ family response regulator